MDDAVFRRLDIGAVADAKMMRLVADADRRATIGAKIRLGPAVDEGRVLAGYDNDGARHRNDSTQLLVRGLGRAGGGAAVAARDFGARFLRQPYEHEERAGGDQCDGDECGLEIARRRDRLLAARQQRQVHGERADRDADRDRDLLGDRDQRGRAAHASVVDLGIGDGVEARELERAEEAADDQHPDDPGERHARREGRVSRHDRRADQRVDHERAAEAEAPQDDRDHRLHAHGADHVRQGDQPRLEGGEVEAELEEERQQERDRADARPEDEAAEDRGPQGRELQQRQVEHRRRRAPRMPHIGVGGERAAGDHRGDETGRQEIEAEQRAAEGEPADAEPCEHGTAAVERIARLGAHVGDEYRRQHDAGEPDWDVDQEDPVPGDVGGDEAADRRAEQRSDQSGEGDPDHGIDQLALVGAAHQDQARHRRHHRAAHALHDARDHELGQRVRQRAADRAQHEHGDRAAEHGAGAEAVGGPAADRDEHREREQVGGDRELERERVRADVGGDRGERRRDHGRVHVLHEQGDRDDQRHDAFGQHERRWLERRSGCGRTLKRFPARGNQRTGWSVIPGRADLGFTRDRK